MFYDNAAVSLSEVLVIWFWARGKKPVAYKRDIKGAKDEIAGTFFLSLSLSRSTRPGSRPKTCT